MTDLVQALRDRLESDAFLGIREWPVKLSRRAIPPVGSVAAERTAAASPARPAVSTSARRGPARVPMDESEIKRRTVALMRLDDEEVKACEKCGLSTTRNKTVFGTGAPNARIMFVGEGPGENEDLQGEPFVGEAGGLLTRMIEAGMGLKRSDVYICNIVKCRPPGNRNPAPDEILACKAFLLKQIEIVQPEVIIALGAPAAQTLLEKKDGVGRLRGHWHTFTHTKADGEARSIPVMPTYHPSFLMRSPGDKKKTWADLRMVMERLDLPEPPR